MKAGDFPSANPSLLVPAAPMLVLGLARGLALALALTLDFVPVHSLSTVMLPACTGLGVEVAAVLVSASMRTMASNSDEKSTY